jgi:hypothetical protein
MSQTISQLCKQEPLLASATRHLTHLPQLRRQVITTIKKLKETTAPSDLPAKVVDELLPIAKHFFSAATLKHAGGSDFAIKFNLLEKPVNLACAALSGEVTKSNLECHYLYSTVAKSDKTMREIAKGVHLSNMQQRVFISDPTVEVAIVDNLLPHLFIEADVKVNAKRARFQSPRTCTFVKLYDADGTYQNRVLMLFHSFSDKQQARFIIDDAKVKSFAFKPIGEGYIQDGTNIIPAPAVGNEFAVNKMGDAVKVKSGKVPAMFVVDTSNRGEMGAVGPKGDKGDTGQQGGTFIGTDASTWAIKALYDGKHPVLTLHEFEKALRGELIGAAIPMSKSFFTFIERERNRKATLGTDYTEKTWIEEMAHG